MSGTFPLDTRVVVDLAGTGEALLRAREMVYQLNWCTRRDGIEVRHRRLQVN